MMSVSAGGLVALALADAAAAPDAAAPPARAGTPGRTNSLTDVAGLRVGHAEDAVARTGVTVILPDARATAAVDVRGGGPGTRETDALNSWNLVHSADAIVLSGGSVYGLAAADGVCCWLGAQGRGYVAVADPAVPRAPIVPAAILFDLANGGNKGWGMEPPYRRLGIAAAAAAASDFALGSAGAGYGAAAGALKGGIGSASLVTEDGMTIGGLGPAPQAVPGEQWGAAKVDPSARAHTTIACVATDVTLTPDEMKRVTIMAQDGLARAIRPAHSPFDGDVVFGLSTARLPLSDTPARAFLIARIGAAAADTLARAIARAVFEATLPPGMKGATWKQP